jgi:hypothetical protein
MAATFRIKDPEEKVKARQELLGAGLKDKLLLLSKHVVRAATRGCSTQCSQCSTAALRWLASRRAGDRAPTLVSC